ncbi:MAG TPA: hypothetical protein VJY62_04640 [Bacteroidia bacterium]|nr:hypothetical protein [Bacteroidia bacterium]
MKTKLHLLRTLTLFLLIALCGCKKEIFEKKTHDFKVNSFVSNIKCYNVTAEYSEDNLPVDTGSSSKPDVAVESWVIKGKDMLVSVTVPQDAEEIYFGAANSAADYVGLHFEGEHQNSASGYYRLLLANINNPDTVSNDFINYLLVLSTNENIQVDAFDLFVSYKTLAGKSNQRVIPVNVRSIAPYQRVLKVAFRPLTTYSNTLTINSPYGTAFTYSYDSNTGNSTSSDPMTNDNQFNVNWVDLDPVPGVYTINANVIIEIIGSGTYSVELFFIIYAEGKINQVTLTPQINYGGGSTATAIGIVRFNYFVEPLDGLPPCPCTYSQALGLINHNPTSNPEGDWVDFGHSALLDKYHYGATHEVRWFPCNDNHYGQQCNYDALENLITGGLAAGTPDKHSPGDCGVLTPWDGGIHNIKDVKPWEKDNVWSMSCFNYLDNWPPNNQLGCTENKITIIDHLKPLLGNMSCEEATILIKSANGNNSIDSDLRSFILTGSPNNLSDQFMIDALEYWKINILCFSNPSDTCKVIDKVIDNLQ